MVKQGLSVRLRSSAGLVVTLYLGPRYCWYDVLIVSVLQTFICFEIHGMFLIISHNIITLFAPFRHPNVCMLETFTAKTSAVGAMYA